ncbi:MAG TPA: bifunctional glutamate N-acetyltransferase/amino-acid acetyltransferase ArgJ [bacterium]|nr:bifunctional glutamate N-acetyltransferase/amino-acid acetyltransferase ArgJ [bacterium]HOL49114.1 bifunctional glutamate N-acetyltransferase/amino-acid acetyltransferase ArgJ [bacterium]HPO52101.1 bifunctional glutamate N-acetyltransferase/amino-acid acetyltransferase ArgJ [bacterium]
MKTRTGVCFPDGFRASGINCGIKKERKDLAVIISEQDCIAAACSTTNRVKSYSLLWALKNIKNPVRAILINSGNANVLGGDTGWDITCNIMRKFADAMRVDISQVLFASTGVIGKLLPEDKITRSIEQLVNQASENGGMDAAEAIMTTDRFPKHIEIETQIQARSKNTRVRIGGMAKGAGMICPNMATMLGFITTDAVISQSALKKALKDAVDKSFNMITVDNDQSTNDFVVCMANGMAGNRTIHQDTEDYGKFATALTEVCVFLARKIAENGEGSDRLIEVHVCGAWSQKDARRIAKKIAGSNLVKAAVTGTWPNWGRIAAAAGSACSRFDPLKMKISIGKYDVFDGAPCDIDETIVRKELSKKQILITVSLNAGKESATAWGCNLTEEYVRINMEKE